MSSTIRSLILGGVALGTLVAPAVPAEAIPGVRFKRFNEYYEGEGVGTVTLIVEVTEAPTIPASISWETGFGAATPGEDYVAASGVLTWDPGDDSDREIEITILQDSEYEFFDEDVPVQLLGETAIGLETRFPDAGFVHIVDDDGPAYFVVGEAVERSWLGLIQLLGEEGGSVDLTIRLPEFPTTPVTVDYTASPDTTVHSVVFDGVQEQTVSVAAPDVPPGEDVGTRELQILGAPLRRGDGDQETSRARVNTINATALWGSCGVCILMVINAVLGFDGDGCDIVCPFCTSLRGGLARSLPWLTTLTRYRDEILSQTSDGLYYTELYETLSPHMGGAFVRHPWFVHEMFRARDEWIDGFQAIVDGTGASMVVTPSMQARLDRVLDRFLEVGSPELVAAIQLETARLDLRNLAGLSMEDVQNAIEASGASPVEPTSWGQLKARYR